MRCNRFSVILILAAVAVAASALTTGVQAATISTSTTAPTVDGADIASLPTTGTSPGVKYWHWDGWNAGQTFTIGSDDVELNAITVRVWENQQSQPTKVHELTIGEISGNTFVTEIQETATQTTAWGPNDYATFTLDTPIEMDAGKTYGFDLVMLSSTSGWQSGIPYLHTSGDLYADGSRFSATSSTPIQHTSPFNFQNGDMVFHLDMEAAGDESPSLTLGSRVLVSENNQNFNISVFDGKAGYDNTGTTEPLVTGTFGDGTVEDYNFVGNAGTGSALTTYASGGAGLTPTPTSPAANVHGNGEDWADVWTVTDPVGFTTTKDHNPTGVAGAANTFARSADAVGSIDISELESGTVYIPHGTYIDQWDLTLTMTGDGQPDLTATDAQTSNGPGTNFGWITDFEFSNPGLLYDTITYDYFNADRDGSRARFMGVILDGTGASAVPEPGTFVLAALGLCCAGLSMWVRRRRR